MKLLLFFCFLISLAKAQRVVEEFTFSVEPTLTEKFIEQDRKIWTTILSKQPGFLKKEVIQSLKMPSEIKLLIHWRSPADWTAFQKTQIAETNQRFEKAMGGAERFKLKTVRTYQFHREDFAQLVASSPTLELSDLNLKPFRDASVSIPHDGVYRKLKAYRAIPLKDVLEQWLKNLPADITPDSHEVIFECGDGYAPARPLSEMLDGHGFIAFADKDAPDGKPWTPKKKANGSDLVIAPFYLVWDDEVKKKAASRPWPHNLLRLKMVPSEKRYSALAPRNPNHVQGFRLFKKHCIVCHALGGTGGTMGPELHAPRNVTTYWKKDQLIPFIKNPSSFRKQAKMPSMAHLGDQDLAKIVAYLEGMAAK